VREYQALVSPKPPQGVLVRGHSGPVINKLSLMWGQVGDSDEVRVLDCSDPPWESAVLSLSLSLSLALSLSLSLSFCLSVSISLSLSLYVYIYIYIYITLSLSLSRSLSLFPDPPWESLVCTATQGSQIHMHSRRAQ